MHKNLPRMELYIPTGHLIIHLRERFTILANIRGKLIIVHINRLIQIPLFLEVHYWGVVIFFKLYNYPNVNFYTITSKSIHLDPILSNVSERTIDTVSIGIVPDFLVSSSNGWYYLENWSGIPTRWMSENASLVIYGRKDRSVSLNFQAISFYVPRTLEIYSGNQMISFVDIPTHFIPVNVTIPLKNGKNDIWFFVPEGCDRPTDLPHMKNNDNRCLSFAIQNITIN